MNQLSASFIALCLFLCATLPAYFAASITLMDTNESCEFWASVGECKKNPRYMLVNCALSCDSLSKKSHKVPKSFYEIVEKDIHGNDISFERFKGKVVYMINVASQCGYTEENYKQFRSLQKYYGDGLEIVLAPCNSFGGQEPGSPEEIYLFANRKGFSGIILEKDEVNGDATRSSFLYLKQATGKGDIQWNFDGKFVIDRNGQPHLAEEDLEAQISSYLSEPMPEEL